jgi:hypothetical protein
LNRPRWTTRRLLRAFGAQKARLLAADEAVAALAFPSEAEAARSAAYATAQLEAARLRLLGLELAGAMPTEHCNRFGVERDGTGSTGLRFTLVYLVARGHEAASPSELPVFEVDVIIDELDSDPTCVFWG